MIKKKFEALEPPNVEIELGVPGNKNIKIFLIIYFDPIKIMIDTTGLPDSATLCAMHDGEPFLFANVGKTGKIQRKFLNIDWVINKWGGPKDLIEAIKKRKEITLKDIPRLKEKYLC